MPSSTPLTGSGHPLLSWADFRAPSFMDGVTSDADDDSEDSVGPYDSEDDYFDPPAFSDESRCLVPCPTQEAFDAVARLQRVLSERVLKAANLKEDLAERLMAGRRFRESFYPALANASELLCARIACRLWGNESDDSFIRKASTLEYVAAGFEGYTDDLDFVAYAMNRLPLGGLEQIATAARLIREEVLARWTDYKPSDPLSMIFGPVKADAIPVLMALSDETLVMLTVTIPFNRDIDVSRARFLSWKGELAAAVTSSAESDFIAAMKCFDTTRTLEAEIKTIPSVMRIDRFVEDFRNELSPVLENLRSLPAHGGRPLIPGIDAYLDVIEDQAVYEIRYDGNTELPDELVLNPITIRMWVSDLMGEFEDTPRFRELLLALVESPWTFKRVQVSKADEPAAKAVRKLASFFKATRTARAVTSLVGLLRDPSSTIEQILCSVGDCCVAQILTDEHNDLTASFLRCKEKVLTEAIYLYAKFPNRFEPVLCKSDTELIAATPPRVIIPFRPVALPVESIPDAKPQRIEREPVVPKPSREVVGPIVTSAAPFVSAKRTIRLEYVMNPESRHPRTVLRECDFSEVEGVVATIIGHHADVTEPAHSLARAVVHFALETPIEHHLTWNKERVGSYSFHKLKRGQDRIFIRVRKDAVIFHAFARRDWKKASAA